MMALLDRFAALGILLALASGCGQKDMTQTLRIQQSGLLGRWYAVPADSELVRHYGKLVIVAPDEPHWQRARRVGKVSAGTKIVTCRVVRKKDIELSVLPVPRTYESLLGMIVDGPHAGDEVDLSAPGGAKLDPIAPPATQPVRFWGAVW